MTDLPAELLVCPQGGQAQKVCDTFVVVEDDAPLPSGDVIVSRARWLAQTKALRQHPGRVGARFTADENPVDDGVALGGLDLIALEFPKFADGRPYTYARKLRRGHYQGQLRAVGDVLHDQLRSMWRCGFDAFELAEGVDAEHALKAFGEFSVDYQFLEAAPSS